MNRILSTLVLALVLLLAPLIGCKSEQSAESAGAAKFKVGSLVPEFSLNTIDGQTFKFPRDVSGRVVLLNFWATWCPPCVAEMGALERVHQILAASGVEVIGVNVDAMGNRPAVQKFVAERGLTFKILSDPEFLVPEKFAVSGFPETLLISKSGHVLALDDPELKREVPRIMGDRPWDAEAYLKMLRIAAESAN